MTTTIDAFAIKSMRPEIEKALEEVAKKFGVTFRAGNAKFGGTHGEIKLEISTVATTGEVLTREAENFKRLANIFGLKPEHLGKTFVSMGTTYKITGLNPGAPRFPLLAERVRDGRGFKFPADSVRGKFAA